MEGPGTFGRLAGKLVLGPPHGGRRRGSSAGALGSGILDAGGVRTWGRFLLKLALEIGENVLLGLPFADGALGFRGGGFGLGGGSCLLRCAVVADALEEIVDLVIGGFLCSLCRHGGAAYVGLVTIS